MMTTRSLMMKKCRNLKNEIETRWGDSMNLLYCSHIINKSRRSDTQRNIHHLKIVPIDHEDFPIACFFFAVSAIFLLLNVASTISCGTAATGRNVSHL